MTALENFVSPALTRALGWTLLHSLWQGALVAAVLAGALLLLRRQRAEVRYAASAGALGLVVALAGLTFGLYFTAGAGEDALNRANAANVVGSLSPTPAATLAASAPHGRSGVITAVTAPNAQARRAADAAPLASLTSMAEQPATLRSVAQALNRSLAEYFDQHLPLLVVAWLLGLLAMSLRMLGGLLYVQRLRRYRVRPLSAEWQARLAVLTERAGLRRPVALLESALVRVPLVVGHVRPVILLPLGTVAGLSPGYLEAILAHELAHVLRRDYLVNLLQTVAEVLFFYHPAVWFVANCVRTERENSCDDAATALVGGDSLRLARALTALAEWTQSAVVPAAPRLALAAMGRPGALLIRVRRLVQRRPAPPTLAESFMAGALVLGGLGLLGSTVALAGPLVRPAGHTGRAAFDWQTGSASQLGELTDTTKRKKEISTTTTISTTATDVMPPLPATPDTPVMPGEQRREVSIVQEGPGVDELLEDDSDTIRSIRRHSRRNPIRVRENRRIIVNGREMTPMAFPGNPGTVVITKDKKGRLTDLVVNGQRVETTTGKGKIKIKDKKGKGEQEQQVEIIRMLPPGPEGQTYVFRSGDAKELERNLERNFEFRGPEFNKQFGEQFGKEFNLRSNGQSSRLRRIRIDGPEPDQATALHAQQEALRTAERSLRAATAAKNLSAGQRKELGKELEKVRVQLKQLEKEPMSQQLRREEIREEIQERQVEMQERQRELQERHQEMQERRQELKERIRESQEELRDLERDRADRDQDRADRGRDRDDALVAELQKDGLIKDKDNFQLKLTARSLTVNGKEQPAKVLQKYLKRYEASTGRKMSANGAMVINRNGRTSDERRYAPRPPRPPRAPRAPLAPLGLMDAPPAPPMAPMVAPMAPPPPPAPPAPPRLDTETLRRELRKDGLIGANDKGFQLQLNAAGLTVNGKQQSDELAAKYRKLAGHADGKNFNMTISTQ